jgi:peroxiredoxin Q/BCP
MKKAPLFCLFDQDNKQHCLSDYSGKWILVYMYPKDDTPGCTKEACAIRDSWAEFEKLGAVVLGISGDTSASHKKFEQKYNLPFPLLADEDREVIKSFSALGEKSMFGKAFIGIKRESFLINPEGLIAKHYTNVKPEIHAEEVLKDLEIFMKK